jgi:hypothetical protein
MVLIAVVICAAITTLSGLGFASDGVFGVRDYGAAGDGKKIDTAAINKAVKACADAGGGQVRFGPGRYISGTVHLKDNVTLFFEAGATLVGTTRLDTSTLPPRPARPRRDSANRGTARSSSVSVSRTWLL